MAQPNEIYDKYLTRAISEINELTGEILRCGKCRHARAMPVIGSGLKNEMFTAFWLVLNSMWRSS